MDPLNAVKLQHNATIISSDPEAGGMGGHIQHQLCRHYSICDASDPTLTMDEVYDALRGSAYIIIVLSVRLLSDPWLLQCIDFVERLRGEDSDNNYSKIWIKESTLPCCEITEEEQRKEKEQHLLMQNNNSSSQTFGATSFDRFRKRNLINSNNNSNNNSHNNMLRPKSNQDVLSGIELSEEEQSLLQQKINDENNSSLKEVEMEVEVDDEKKFKFSDDNNNDDNNNDNDDKDKSQDNDWARLIAPSLEIGYQRLLFASWSHVPLVPKSKHNKQRGSQSSSQNASRSNSILLSARGENETSLSYLNLNNNPEGEENQGESVSFYVGAKLRSKFEHAKNTYGSLDGGDNTFQDNRFNENQKKRICLAIRKGLAKAIVFTSSIGLGAGMEVRECLGPSLQACSVVLNHSKESRLLAPDFFFQRIERLNLSGRPLSEVAVFHIADALDHSRTLQHMHINEAHLNDFTCGTVCNAIIRDQQPHLKTLTLKSNGIGQSGARSLARLIELNDSITFFDLKPNPFHHDLVANKLLCKAIMKNEVLSTLNGLKFYYHFHHHHHHHHHHHQHPHHHFHRDYHHHHAQHTQHDHDNNNNSHNHDKDHPEATHHKALSDNHHVSLHPELAVLGGKDEASLAATNLDHHIGDSGDHLELINDIPNVHVAHFHSENPHDSLAAYELSFIAKQLLKPPPPPPPPPPPHSNHHIHLLSSFSSATSSFIGNAHKIDKSNMNHHNNNQTAEGEEIKHDDDHMNLNHSFNIKSNPLPHMKETNSEQHEKSPALFDSKSSIKSFDSSIDHEQMKALVLSLSLVGRSITVGGTRILSKGISESKSLIGLDLRHNPFEDEEDAFDRAQDSAFVSASRSDFVYAAKLVLSSSNQLTGNSFDAKAPVEEEEDEDEDSDESSDDEDDKSIGSDGEASHKSGHKKKKNKNKNNLIGASGALFPPATIGAGGQKFPMMFPSTAATGGNNYQPIRNIDASSTNPSIQTGGSGGGGTTTSAYSPSSFSVMNKSQHTLNPNHPMNQNNYKEPLCQMLGDALRNNTGIRILNGMEISDQDEVEFSKNLRTYEIEWISGKLCQGMSGDCRSLRILSLAQTNLTSRRALSVIDSLTHCPNLEEFDLRHNPNLCGFSICEQVIEAVISHSTGSLHTISAMPIRELLGLPPMNDPSSSLLTDRNRSMDESKSTSINYDKHQGFGLLGNENSINESMVENSNNINGKTISNQQTSPGGGVKVPTLSRKNSSMKIGILKRKSTYRPAGGMGGLNATNSTNSSSSSSAAGNSGKLKLDYSDLGPCELVVLSLALQKNALLPKPIRSLDLSMNMVCGVDKLGQGVWCKDGLDALTLALSVHKHIRTCSLYLNYLGPKAKGAIKRCLLHSSPSLTVLNLQFTDLFPQTEQTPSTPTSSTDNHNNNKSKSFSESSGSQHITPGSFKETSSKNQSGPPLAVSTKTSSSAEFEIRKAATDSGVNLEL